MARPVLTAYQRRQVDYVKANHPCYPKRKSKGMNKRDLAELERQADVAAMAWLDCIVPRWREGKPPKANKIYVAALSVSDADEEQENDE
ncbi:hypothetical protein N7319_14505 [Aeromonas dhakensis]|uniref:hypothetical protein n=1 Tax=Aeromonas dhakensis TaxID=196024 RepID=UPI002447D7DF|nr:hypothetical protein [Aeromonas dhakensis]MDH0176417.1 hypothetical protein [Aeromonas dhakensis]